MKRFLFDVVCWHSNPLITTFNNSFKRFTVLANFCLIASLFLRSISFGKRVEVQAADICQGTGDSRPNKPDLRPKTFS